MTGKRIDNKSDRALELFEKGLDSKTIAERLVISPRGVSPLVRYARLKREREIERLGKLAEILGANI